MAEELFIQCMSAENPYVKGHAQHKNPHLPKILSGNRQSTTRPLGLVRMCAPAQMVRPNISSLTMSEARRAIITFVSGY